MKKSLMMRVGLIALSSLAIVACGGNEGQPSEVEFFELKETDIGTETKAADAKLAGYTEENPLKIGLVTDSGTLNDHSFNESAWAGVNNFATENGGGTINSTSYCVETGKIHTKYVQPAENAYDTQGRLAAMKTVAQWGAKVIILPGFLFQPAIKKAIDDPAFKDVCLLALDCVKEDSDNGYAPYEYTDKVTSVILKNSLVS